MDPDLEVGAELNALAKCHWSQRASESSLSHSLSPLPCLKVEMKLSREQRAHGNEMKEKWKRRWAQVPWHHGMLRGSEDHLQKSALFFHQVGPLIELRSPDLAASTFTCRVIFLALKFFFFFFLESPHHPAAFHSDRLSFIFPPTACIYFYLLFCIWNLFSWIMGFLAVPNTGLIMNLSSQEAKAGQLRIPGLPKLSSKILTWNK